MERSRDDIIVSLHVAVVLNKLSSQALRDFGLVWCVQSELSALSDVLGKVQELLTFAEQAQSRNVLVKRCLRNLRDISYQAEDILDEFIFEACKEKNERHLGGKVNLLHFPFNLNANGILRKHEIAPLINDELIKKLEEMEKKLEDHYLRESGNWKSCCVIDEIDTRPKSSSAVDESFILGRKRDLQAIKNKLFSNTNEDQNKVFVIAIVGLGGVGKTTVAQLVYCDPDVYKHFQRRAWVCVSTDFNAVRLISAILESLNKKSASLSNLEPLQCELRKELMGKRVLIILDDVWTEKRNDWESLRVAFMAAGEGSRIIVTSRSRRVSSMMHPVYTHDLQILSDEECWSIIERHISSNYGSISPSLESVGTNIARKCKGLPLAASTLAGLLSSSLDVTHWQEVLNSCMWDLEESTFPAALSLSYYFLPTYLKQCFAYCCLFPKDYQFDKHRLIQLWIAEGFIRSNAMRMKDKAVEYFDDLVHRSLFQHSSECKDLFVMHDLVHDLAQAVSGELCGPLECSKLSHRSKETRYSSICCVNVINMDKVKQNKRLSTLVYLRRFSCSSTDLFIESFGGLRYLRVLDLSASKMKMLPDDIGDLKCLQYVNLSYAHDIKHLPESLCRLFNLRSLILRFSGICELPRGMRYLCNLQHLDLYECRNLLSMPQGIGRLTSLKTLSEFPVSKVDDGSGIRELKELRQLEGALSICKLENLINPLDALEADLRNKQKVDELNFMWNCSGDKDVAVFESLQPHTELRSLLIFNYSGLTFPRWLLMDLPSYKKLVSLTLKFCWECRVLPPIGELPLLESLHLQHMKLEEWSSSSRSEVTEFPSLQNLTIEDCPELRILPEPLLSSPRLRELHFNGCPKLRMLPNAGLRRLTSLKNLHLGYQMEGLVEFLDETETLPPNLTRLYIRDCKSLPKGLRNLSSLEHLEFSPACKAHYSPVELPRNVVVTEGWASRGPWPYNC